MKLVDRPAFRPMRCAAIPYIAQTTPNVRWVDTGSTLDGFDNHVYLSSTAVEEAMKVLGLPSRQQYAQMRHELAHACEERDHYRAECERLEAALEDAESFRRAVDVIESADFTARKKAGRPRKEAA